MRIRSLLILVFLFNFLTINAQVPAPNIKATDIFGNFYNSEDILNEGKFIFIDFFNTSCSSCQYVAPYIDSAYQELGCNCGDIFYFAINVYDWSTDEEVFDFTQQFGLEMPAISGEGGGGHIAQLYEIPFTPYFDIISPDGYIIWDTAMFITNTQEWLDTMANHGIFPAECKGTDLLYYEAKTATDTFYASIDTENKTATLQIPEFTDVSNLEVFMITSSKAEVFIEDIIQNQDSSIVDLTDSLLTYTIFSENDTIYNDWNIILQTAPVHINNQNNFRITFNTETNYLNFSDVLKVEQYFIFDMYGRKIFDVYPTNNEQDFNHLTKGIYIVSVKLKDGRIYNKKVLIS